MIYVVKEDLKRGLPVHTHKFEDFVQHHSGPVSRHLAAADAKAV